MPAHFLVKSEPYKYAFETLQKDKLTRWDGVRNFEARNNLRAMKKGDLLLFYHSNEGKEIVGIAKVVRTAYADPTASEGDWAAVDIAPLKALKSRVSLEAIRNDKKLATIQLLRRPRLSVVPVTPTEFSRVLELGETKL